MLPDNCSRQNHPTFINNNRSVKHELKYISCEEKVENVLWRIRARPETILVIYCKHNPTVSLLVQVLHVGESRKYLLVFQVIELGYYFHRLHFARGICAVATPLG